MKLSPIPPGSASRERTVNILFLIDPAGNPATGVEGDRSYIARAKALLAPNINAVFAPAPAAWGDLRTSGAKLLGAPVDGIFVSCQRYMNLIPRPFSSGNADLRGSYLVPYGDGTCPVIPIAPLSHLFSVPEAPFLFQRYVSKVSRSDFWYKPNAFDWELVKTPAQRALALDACSRAELQAWDIETSGISLGIASVSVYDGKKAWVFPLDGFGDSNPLANVRALRTIAQQPAAKIFHNGIFDQQYLLRYSIITSNWLWDTMLMQYCYYAEMPKDLGFTASFWLHDAIYWKDEGKSGNRIDFFRYNARDTWATYHILLAQLNNNGKSLPDYVRNNYLLKFKMMFPWLACNMEGLLVDEAARLQCMADQTAKNDTMLASIRLMTGDPNFNPASPPQMLALLKLYGYGDATSADDKHLEKWKDKHPLAIRFVDAIRKYRESGKLLSTYLDAPRLNNRIYYSGSPMGAETGRASCRASSFSVDVNISNPRAKVAKWKNYGFQVQNVAPYVKKFLRADPGFVLCEIDKSQSESRCTGYLSQDLALIDAVENSPDFHCYNASKFFGIPFEELFEVATGKVLNKALRTLAKPVNHGANYNMAAQVLIDSMGPRRVIEAKELLKLPKLYSLTEVAVHLLMGFCNTYPRIKGRGYTRLYHERGGKKDAVSALFNERTWYGEIITQIETTGRMVSPSGWTRICLGNPRVNKSDLNKYVAHGPQHLSVALVDEAFFDVLLLQLGKYAGKLWLKAQIHDSILFQVRPEFQAEIIPAIQAIMNSKSCVIHGRTMVIPTDAPDEGKLFWSDLK